MTEASGMPCNVVSHANENGEDNKGFEMQEDVVSFDSRSSIKKEKLKKGLGCLRKVSKPINAIEDYFKAHSKTIKYIVLGLLGAGYVAYFITACVLDFERAIALVVLTSLAVVSKAYDLVKKYKGESITKCFIPAQRSATVWTEINSETVVFVIVVLVLLVTWLVVDTSKRPEQLISFGGVCMFILVIFLFSAHRKSVAWRPVFWGLGLQFCIGLFVIRTEPGLIAFQWLGEQVQIFLNYTKSGSEFVFGPLTSDIFAFQALPIVIFFSSVMSVLYFLGIMQWLIIKIAWVMQITMGTSPTETLSVAGNIFVGQTEAPLLIRPYLENMTKSEVHAVMVGGFATIAGSVMGAFISFGIDASSLISASVMAAPCALAVSKLSYPEVEESPFKSEENIKVACGDEKNILEAASSGASASISLVANIAANLIAFLAILAFINASLGWLGGLVGYPSITFEMICSYVFMPVAFMMGIPFEESFTVAELIGTKLFLNEFLAYEKLSAMKKNRVNGLDEFIDDKRQWISVRSEIISTYALCGFANFSSLGIVIGGLSSICPPRRGLVSSLVLRALFTGTCVTLVNACVAVVLYGIFLQTSSKSNCMLCSSTVKNGTISFEGSWSTETNATLFFNNCCGLFDNPVCN
uniref:Sodium/nucleoside cotransporter n=1 Tax=Esox lucius TaxID=8010 RepID=A0A3P8YSL5_ESOLU